MEAIPVINIILESDELLKVVRQIKKDFEKKDERINFFGLIYDFKYEFIRNDDGMFMRCTSILSDPIENEVYEKTIKDVNIGQHDGCDCYTFFDLKHYIEKRNKEYEKVENEFF